MATKQRSRQRRSTHRDRSPRYVAPVLDPTWQSPYAPTSAERHANHRAVRDFAFRRRMPQTVVISIVVGGLIGGVAFVPWLPIIGVAIAGLYAWELWRALQRAERQGRTLGASLAARFDAGGTAKDQERLTTVIDRLSATFGSSNLRAVIVRDEGYNAALVPGARDTFVVTDALVRDFELIELEGVVAHCLARQRLGLLMRESLACVSGANDEARRELAGVGATYRADEVAAAAIRYPLGLAGALRRCADQSLPTSSYFASPDYDAQRWIWFDVHLDRMEPDPSDLDDVILRARALEEW
ncbi:MAG TPA: hypothetical protein VND83_02405 [Acidimicrobiales bacterium]|nr:hypothetical protein [Acidimicrobiales bacterium]